MSYVLNPDQVELRTVVRSFLEHESPLAKVREAAETPDGYDRALWARMATELGLAGVGVPEEHGGTGETFVDVCVVSEELGRALTPAPFLASVVLGTRLLLESGDEDACRLWLPALVSGELVATAALVEGFGDWRFARVATTARETDGGWILSGEKRFVPHGHTADLLLVLAESESGPTLMAVRPGDAVRATRLDALDATRPLADVTFTDAPGEPIGEPGDGGRVLERALALTSIALACEQVGGAGRTLDMAVEYAKERVQFGRAIGSFQAIKHMLADRLLDNESASAAAYYAAWSVDHVPEEVPALASLCKAFCSDAYFDAATTNVQVHGGIGFTWEHDAHLFLKRAIASKALLGSPELHRERIAAQLLDAPATVAVR